MKICPVCSREYAGDRSHCSDDGIALVALSTGASAKAADLSGQIVDGRYKVERVLGKGGMGTVYACRHVVVGRAFAMKVLKPGVDRSEEVLHRFIREAQTANAIKSRHIVEMSDFGQLPSGSFYVVMELLEGEDLTRAMKSGRLGRRELTHVFVQIAEALGLAHAQGIVHRDLKPDNVFLVNEANDPLFVKLLDFGIAKVLHTGASTLTETGIILGTPYYMSPEQARAENIDHRSDVYSLGVMMYRAFTGRLPFVADSAMGVLTRHLTEPPELPSKITDVDIPLERVILRCLEKKPGDRFQSMHEVAAALRSYGVSPSARGAAPQLRDEATVVDRGSAGAAGRFDGAYTPASPGETPAPSSAAELPLPPAVFGAEPTSRGLVTSSTGRSASAAPSRGALIAAAGACTMVIVGAALAFGLLGRSRAAPAHAQPTAAVAEAAAPPPSPEAATAAASAAPPAPPAPAPPAPSAAPAASSAPAATITAAAGKPPPGRLPARAGAATAPPTATAPPRRPEIRSPFD